MFPHKFKVPEFERYNGTTDPTIHLKMYCWTMALYTSNESLLIQTFQYSLTGPAIRWYFKLEEISCWKDLADAFLEQYSFNNDIPLDRFDLQRMEKKSEETFHQYVRRWWMVANVVQPPLTKKEVINIFLDTLKPPYYDMMIGSAAQDLSDLLVVGKRIEEAIEDGMHPNYHGLSTIWESLEPREEVVKDLDDAFLSQCRFNAYIAPNRFDLQRMEKKNEETFREYAQRWREQAAQVEPWLTEKEMIRIFFDTLKTPYFDLMIASVFQHFSDLVVVGIRIEDGIKSGKL